MTNPVWKKVTQVEPGLYYYGGPSIEPSNYHEILEYRKPRSFNHLYWYARIGDIPPEPVMPRPDLKIDDPVWVWDAPNQPIKRHFAGWSSDGLIMTWSNGGTSWTRDASSSWTHYRLPTADELKNR